eukprot:5201360-Prymnesium_polylepis.1
MQRSAAVSSRVAAAHGDRLDAFLVGAAHHIFYAVFFGHVLADAAPSAAAREFCRDASGVLSANAVLG